MFYRIKYLLAATAMLCISLPPKVAFSQSESTNVKQKDISQTNIPVPEVNKLKKEQLRKKALQLYTEGETNYNQSKYQQALEKFEQALPILQQIGDKSGEAATLNYIGQIYINLKQYSKASDFLNRALPNWQRIRRRLPDYGRLPRTKPDGRVNSLPNEPSIHTAAPGIGDSLPSESQPKIIIQEETPIGTGNTLPNQSLPPLPGSEQPCISCTSIPIGETIIGKTNKKELSGVIKNNLGLAYLYQGKYDKAEESIYQALDFFRKIDSKTEQGNALNNLGELYRHRSKYPKAFKYLNQAKEIFQENKNQLGIGTTINNIGLVHDELGQHHQALKHYQESLEIRKKIKDERGIGTSLHNIGFVHDRLEEDDKALEFYRRALKFNHQLNNRGAIATTLNNMGLIYNKLGQHPSALQYLKQSKKIFQKLNYPSSEANTLDSLGTVYKSQGNYQQASEAYNKALDISQKIGNRHLEKIILSNIGDLFVEQKQPELAIIFYKQSVKITEEIRKGLQTLPLEQQKSYTKTVADTYRNLADLLLKQNGVQEAQQVLDLLKVEEVEDYLHSTRTTKAQRLEDYLANIKGVKGYLTILPSEQNILDKYNQKSKTAIELGQKLSKLQQIVEPTPAHQAQIDNLILFQQELNKEINRFAEQEDIERLLNKLSPEARKQIVDIKSLDSLRDDLHRLDAVIIYPLVLDDRLELIITTPDSPPLRRTVNIKSSELNQEILNFRQALQNPHSNVKTSAKRLYDLLIEPLEKDLNQAKPKTIIYAPDGKLRYIPLAALHDGNQWLIERYKVNNITAKSLTDFTAKPKPFKKMLAGAFGEAQYNIEIGQRNFPFAQLPFTLPEVENLAKIIPQTKKLINEQFSKNAVIRSMNEHDILHFATHAAFVPEDASQSFILFGNGEKATLEEIGNWTLNNVDLVVLSACETGLGGFGNGEEVLGLGYQFQNRGVRATIASLWRVSDGGTKTLMDEFYKNALKADVTKAEALRQAQIALINDDGSTVDVKNKNRSIIDITKVEVVEQPEEKTKKFQHPYYWAPFILIGNGL
ncbi:MAG: tetratricopeptide repeat protein [Cyanobacteriota bacterium]|nr:tetratricopeptide repeat protein [Cyanobacteriota bacterium]